MYTILAWLVTLLMPVVLVMGAVRIVLNPWYLDFEYRTPGFPVEPYGFTLEDRLEYAGLALEYLVNDAGIEFLGELRFPDGELVPQPSCSYMDDCNLQYNERELKHMLDVKNVLSAALNVWLVSLLVVVGLGIWAWRGGWLSQFRQGLSRGGLWTLVLIAVILAVVLAAFGVFFVFFHNLFFEEGTWMFFYSDTLIRLFPERFWRDTFLTVGGLTVLMAFIILLGTRAVEKRARQTPVGSDH
jgi:integral membrane protein (TIGR01906 family)